MKPDHLSPSQENMLDLCPQRWAFRYGEGIKRPPGFALFRGRAVHSGVEANMIHKMDEGEPLPVKDVQELSREALEREVNHSEFVLDGDYEGMTIAKAKGFVTEEVVGLAKEHTENVAPLIEPTAVELRVEMQPSDALPIKYVGVLDLIDRGVRIRDTKTKQKSPPKGIADKSPQLSAYSMLFAAHFGKLPDELTLDNVVRTPGRGELKNVILKTTRDAEDIQIAVARANAHRKMIEAEVFPPAQPDHWTCSERWCGYTDICPFFRRTERPTT